MATTMTLLQLRTASKQRADMVNSTFVSDAEWTSYINQSYFELYDLLVQKYGNNYYIAPPLEIPTNGTDQLYPLPDGTNYSGAPELYKIAGIDLFITPDANAAAITLKSFQFSERNKYAVPGYRGRLNNVDLRYCVLGTQLMFNVPPQASQMIKLWYVPRMTQLANDTDVVDGVSGWTEYIIIDAAIKAMQKEESDVSVLLAQKQAMIARIEAAGEHRNAGSPTTVADSQLTGSDGALLGIGGGWYY